MAAATLTVRRDQPHPGAILGLVANVTRALGALSDVAGAAPAEVEAIHDHDYGWDHAGCLKKRKMEKKKGGLNCGLHWAS
jgi:hypothetical protein